MIKSTVFFLITTISTALISVLVEKLVNHWFDD